MPGILDCTYAKVSRGGLGICGCPLSRSCAIIVVERIYYTATKVSSTGNSITNHWRMTTNSFLILPQSYTETARYPCDQSSASLCNSKFKLIFLPHRKPLPGTTCSMATVKVRNHSSRYRPTEKELGLQGKWTNVGETENDGVGELPKKPLWEAQKVQAFARIIFTNPLGVTMGMKIGHC